MSPEPRNSAADDPSRALDAATIEQLGKVIFDAEREGRQLRPLTTDHPSMTVADAYAVAQDYARRRRADGAVLVGHKIGCTTEAIQRMFGIDTPDYGLIFDDMVVADGIVDLDALIQPMVEPEIAFELHTELRGPGVTPADVRRATHGVRPCMEIIDSRITNWEVALCDSIADNGSSARVVFGSDLVDLGDLDLTAIEVSFARNDDPPVTGTGAAVLGDPIISVAWLANAIGAFGGVLPAGATVLSGSITTAIRAAAGDRFSAVFPGFGSVRCEFRSATQAGLNKPKGR